MKKRIPENAVLIPPEAKRVFSGVLFDVFQWEQMLFDGSRATYEALKRQDTVRVIAVIDGKILIQEESQPNHRRNQTFPGGRVDESDASILAAAKRELLEETGYVLADWRLVAVEQPEVKMEWFVHTYIAWGAYEQRAVNHDKGERITSRLETFDIVKDMSLNNSGYISRARRLFIEPDSLEDLLQTPAFQGRQVDR